MEPGFYDTGSLVTTPRGAFYTIRKGSGSPTVVFDAGLSNDADVWFRVAPAIAERTTICAYDRANVGRSASQPVPRTSHDIVEDLHALLSSMALPPPYILVGHSFGGYNMRLYTARSPEKVYALVLVDTPYELMDQFYEDVLTPTVWKSYLQQWNSEQIDLPKSAAQVSATPMTHPLQTIVVSAAHHSYPAGWPEVQLEALRLQLQAKLAGLFPSCQHIIATQSGHMIQIDQPELLIQLIAGLIEEYRNKGYIKHIR